jgi:hypothetical protein
VEVRVLIKRHVLPAALLAVGALASTTACATGYPYGARPPYNEGAYYGDVERQAYDHGFREGLRAGDRDGRDNRRYEPTRHDDWRDADDGYRRSDGDRDAYKRSFRSGFETGYGQGYRRYDTGRYRGW